MLNLLWSLAQFLSGGSASPIAEQAAWCDDDFVVPAEDREFIVPIEDREFVVSRR